ncbi:MAG TPA: peptidyl-Asp metalloendopeptidase [Acidobacteria bacterium]|nr:peptidyl-Asp metalloendopeptidase [Acidobacteriota bacterium]
MKSLWKQSIGCVAAFLLAAASAQAGPSLFSPLAADGPVRQALKLDASYHALAGSPATESLRLVQARPALLTEKAVSLDLDLGLGFGLRVHRTDAYRVRSGNLVWVGIIENPSAVRVPFSAETVEFEPMNQVVLVRNGGRITGNLHFNGDWYKIRPLRTGGHAVVKVKPSGMPADHPADYADLPVIGMPETPERAVGDTVINVMVHYTQGAAAASGDINGLIDLAVAESNVGYDNSGVTIDLVLVHKSQVTYTESSFSTDLSRYRTPGDGYMDAIHTTRDSVGADVGLLVINNASSCGLASSIGSTAATAFADAHWDCITGYYSFAHEIGHLQSARHDPKNDPTNTPYAWGHGYQYTTNPKWRTIMAYNCTGGGCPRLNFWSNPGVLYNGKPMGTTTKNDNHRVLNDTRATVAAFR